MQTNNDTELITRTLDGDDDESRRWKRLHHASMAPYTEALHSELRHAVSSLKPKYRAIWGKAHDL